MINKKEKQKMPKVARSPRVRSAKAATGLLSRTRSFNRFHVLALVAVVVLAGVAVVMYSSAASQPSAYSVYRQYGCPTAIKSRPTLGMRSSGACVRALQRLLQFSAVGSLNRQPVVDGQFGPVTRSYVIKFQKRYGLAADGVVGPKTWSKIDAVVRINNSWDKTTPRPVAATPRPAAPTPVNCPRGKACAF